MANFDSGVKRYIKTYAVVEVSFPVDWKNNAEMSVFRPRYTAVRVKSGGGELSRKVRRR